jgi:hypothetical protein
MRIHIPCLEVRDQTRMPQGPHMVQPNLHPRFLGTLPVPTMPAPKRRLPRSLAFYRNLGTLPALFRIGSCVARVPSSCSYSPDCVEGDFSEVHMQNRAYCLGTPKDSATSKTRGPEGRSLHPVRPYKVALGRIRDTSSGYRLCGGGGWSGVSTPGLLLEVRPA